MPQNKRYVKIVTLQVPSMQTKQQLRKPSELYDESNIENIELQLFHTDSILNRMQIRERYLIDKLVYAVKNNLHSEMVYARELQLVRALRTKIVNIENQMKNSNFSVNARKNMLGGRIS